MHYHLTPISIEFALSLLIPNRGSSVAEQTLTLKHILCKLNMLPERVKKDVSIGTLKYMQFLKSRMSRVPLQFILDELTATELEALQSLVEYASELLKQQELEKSTILSK